MYSQLTTKAASETSQPLAATGRAHVASDNALLPEMIALPRGEFIMGETPNDKFVTDTERPAHTVAFGYTFAVGAFPVTAAAYRTFERGHSCDDDDLLPVVNVSWEDASSYCHWLAERTGTAFRLPTEAEWEYACRAGTSTAFSCGDDLSISDANYLYSETGEAIGPARRTSKGAYPPNGFGLYDMHGNVCEWVEDAWHESYEGAPADGSAWTGIASELRVIRGGAWDYLPRLLRSAWRDALPHHTRRDNVGFRVALTLPE